MTFELAKEIEAVAGVAAEDADHVDRDAAFPAKTIEAAKKHGLLGLVSAKAIGGQGLGLAEAALVVERLARECGSSAMVLCMHYCATAVIEALGAEGVRREVAKGDHLSTLAFSEAGSRSQFWASMGKALVDGDHVRLSARKSWATSAHHAKSYVWSSKPTEGSELSTIWLVPRDTPGIRLDQRFDGLGLRGNDSAPIVAEDASIPLANRLGADGGGFGIMMGTVLPWFNVLTASMSAGAMDTAVARAAKHVSGARFEHAGSTIADLPTVRAFLARMRIRTDQTKALNADTLAAIAGGRADATLRVLESKAAAGEAAIEVTDLAMRVCGGAAYSKAVGVERVFRDARAALVMAPTTDALYDFIGKAVCGLPLF